MPSEINAVNIKISGAKKSYHHGALAESLIEAAMVLLEEKPAGELSLREVARRSGVSATAVYRHFPDKESLLRAVAGRGFEMMGGMQAEAARASAGLAPFAAVGAAYVRFALAHPAVFRLMFSSAPPKDLFSLPLDQVTGPMRQLREHVAALAPAGASEEDRRVISIRAWSLVHGLAVLALDHMIPADAGLIEAVIGGAAA